VKEDIVMIESMFGWDMVMKVFYGQIFGEKERYMGML
jgi:hypothetical protein